MIRVDVKGLDEVKAQLSALGPRVQAEFEHAVLFEALKGLRRAQRLVPVYTGALQHSGSVSQRQNAAGTTWQFAYSAPYAQFVHEHPNGHLNKDGHPCGCYATKHRPLPGQKRNGHGYKWLERAMGKLDVGSVFRRVRNAALIASGNRNAVRRPSRPTFPDVGGAVSSRPRGRSKSGGGGGGALSTYLRALLKLAARGGGK